MNAGEDDGPFAGLDRATQAMATIRTALTELGEDRRRLIPWVAQDLSESSIAPEILEFATSGTVNCPSGRACARLYLALQGHPIDLRETDTAFDLTRQQWWLRAMFEFSVSQWRGTQHGVAAIFRKHPELRHAPSLPERAANNAVRDATA